MGASHLLENSLWLQGGEVHCWGDLVADGSGSRKVLQKRLLDSVEGCTPGAAYSRNAVHRNTNLAAVSFRVSEAVSAR